MQVATGSQIMIAIAHAMHLHLTLIFDQLHDLVLMILFVFGLKA